MQKADPVAIVGAGIAGLAADREPICVRAAEQRRVCAERDRLQDVGAAPDAAVHQDRRVRAGGVARLPNVPAGAGTLRVWHPWLRTAGNEVMRPLAVGGVPMTQTIAVEIRQPAGAR